MASTGTLIMTTTITILFLTMLSMVSSDMTCPHGYVLYQQRACFLFKHYIDSSVSAVDAELFCRNTSMNKATLATVQDISEDNWLRKVYMHDPSIQYSVWIGLIRDATDPTTFLWRDGNPSTFRHWNKGERDFECFICASNLSLLL